ncbi:MAG: hypothetical protein ABIJ39_04645 [Chloroflexota bacterium]
MKTNPPEPRSGFAGTYFNPSTVLRLSQAARILAWVILVIHLLQWLLSVLIAILQVLRGFWAGMGLTDIGLSILYLFQDPLRGLVYFMVLLAVAQLLLIFLDIEDNTRRAARG